VRSAASPAPAPVVIAIDPRKASWTAVAVDNRLQPLAVIRVEVNRDGYRQTTALRQPLVPRPLGDRRRDRPGAAPTARLTADHIDVVDVPAKLARRVRMLSTGHGRKSDPADALSVGIAAHTRTPASTPPSPTRPSPPYAP